MPIDMNIGMMNPKFDTALDTMAKITDLAHAQAMAPYQFQQAALANRQAQLQSQYYPQQMDTRLANTLANLSGQQLSQDRFLSNVSTLRNLRRGIGDAAMNKLMSQGVPAGQAANIAASTLSQLQQQGLAPYQQQQQPASPYRQAALRLLSRYTPQSIHGLAGQPQGSPATTVMQSTQPKPSQARPPAYQQEASDAAKAIQQASESAAIKSTTDVDARNRVAAGNRLMNAVNKIKPFLSDYAHYIGVRGAAPAAIDRVESIFRGKMPKALQNAQQFRSMLPQLKGELATMLGVPKTEAGMREIDKTFSAMPYDTPESYIKRFNDFIDLANKTHKSNKGVISQQYGKESEKDKKQKPEKEASDILSEFRGK